MSHLTSLEYIVFLMRHLPFKRCWTWEQRLAHLSSSVSTQLLYFLAVWCGIVALASLVLHILIYSIKYWLQLVWRLNGKVCWTGCVNCTVKILCRSCYNTVGFYLSNMICKNGVCQQDLLPSVLLMTWWYSTHTYRCQTQGELKQYTS